MSSCEVLSQPGSYPFPNPYPHPKSFPTSSATLFLFEPSDARRKWQPMLLQQERVTRQRCEEEEERALERLNQISSYMESTYDDKFKPMIKVEREKLEGLREKLAAVRQDVAEMVQTLDAKKEELQELDVFKRKREEKARARQQKRLRAKLKKRVDAGGGGEGQDENSLGLVAEDDDDDDDDIDDDDDDDDDDANKEGGQGNADEIGQTYAEKAEEKKEEERMQELRGLRDEVSLLYFSVLMLNSRLHLNSRCPLSQVRRAWEATRETPENVYEFLSKAVEKSHEKQAEVRGSIKLTRRGTVHLWCVVKPILMLRCQRNRSGNHSLLVLAYCQGGEQQHVRARAQDEARGLEEATSRGRSHAQAVQGSSRQAAPPAIPQLQGAERTEDGNEGERLPRGTRARSGCLRPTNILNDKQTRRLSFHNCFSCCLCHSDYEQTPSHAAAARSGRNAFS